MAEYQDKLLDHDYDGIKELDNDLPRWWLWLFYLTIIFSVFYMTYYHVLEIGYTSAEAYLSETDPNFVRTRDGRPTYFGILPRYQSPYAETHKDVVDQTRKPRPVALTFATDTTTYAPDNSEMALAEGKDIYMRNCASCHGNLGEGGVGPNLTDNYWLHGSDYSSAVKSIRYGFPQKGMISWLGQLQQEQIIKVASYIQTLRGTNPPNAKAPQGEPAGDG